MTMGDKLVLLRKTRCWTQEELAERIGVTRQAVSRWESGAAKPDVDKLVALCDIFGVSADYLLRDTDQMSLANSGAERRKGLTIREMTGIMLLCIGLVALFVLGLLISIEILYISDDHLWWLFLLCWLCIGIGAWLLLGKWFKGTAFWKKLQEYFSDLHTMLGPNE